MADLLFFCHLSEHAGGMAPTAQTPVGGEGSKDKRDVILARMRLFRDNGKSPGEIGILVIEKD